MQAEQLKDRTKQFALRVIRLPRALPRCAEGRVLGQQLLRSGTSVGANYRACSRARSRAEFIAKMSVTLEEADESAYWLELIADAELLPRERLQPLLQEANELTAIFNQSRQSARSNA